VLKKEEEEKKINFFPCSQFAREQEFKLNSEE